MKKNIEIECGETTCASEPGKFCRFVGTKCFGTEFRCLIFFDAAGNGQKLLEKDGWLQRCAQCLQEAK
jgi:hypothetical protein